MGSRDSEGEAVPLPGNGVRGSDKRSAGGLCQNSET